VIRSFASQETESFFEKRKTRSIPPGNRLEALKGDRKGQHSIRINDQCRICFRWKADGPHDVEIVDYH
jgi:proteic killer suppression protein